MHSENERSVEDLLWKRRWELSHLPTQLWHRDFYKYVEYEYDDPINNEKRRVAWCEGNIIHLGTADGIDVYDIYGYWRREYKIHCAPNGGSLHYLRIRNDDPSCMRYEDYYLPKEIHSKVLSDDIFNAPIIHDSHQLLFYIAEAFQPSTPQSIAALAKTKAYDYAQTIETYGEGCDVINPLPFVFDLATKKAFQIGVDTSNLAVKKILPISERRENSLQILLHCLIKGKRKLGLRFCVNRPSKLVYAMIDQQNDFKVITQHVLLTTPFKSHGHQIASIMSPMIMMDSERDDQTLRVCFFGTTHPGEHMSDVSVFQATWACSGSSFELTSLKKSGLQRGLLFPDRAERRRCLLTHTRIRHLPNLYTTIDNEGILGDTIDLHNIQGLSENFLPDFMGRHLAITQDLLTPKRLVVYEAYEIRELDSSQANLPQMKFSHVSTKYKICDTKPKGDVIVRRLSSTEGSSCNEFVHPRRILLWIHGGPNSFSSPHTFSPLLTFILESVEIDLLILPNYRGSLTDCSLYELAGKIGEQDVQDCIKSLDSFIDIEDSDVSVVVGGASHGGFITGHLLAHPSLKTCLSGGIIWNGVLDLNYTYVASDIPDWSMFQATGSLQDSPCRSDDDREVLTPSTWLNRLYNQSPISKVDEVIVPVCILVGMKDIRVPPAQSLRYVERLNKAPCRLYTYPDDGHALSSPRTAFHRDLQIVNFLLNDVGWPSHPNED